MEKKNLFSFLVVLGLGYFIGKQGGIRPALTTVKNAVMPSAPTTPAQ